MFEAALGSSGCSGYSTWMNYQEIHTIVLEKRESIDHTVLEDGRPVYFYKVRGGSFRTVGNEL